ncbi:MAG: hypothetical protein ACI9BO_002006 [Zhongshania sp.]|jgi:hypothetical protein
MPNHYPNSEQLCVALADFLAEEISPVVTDAGLQYKLRIANNLLKILARQVSTSEAVQDQELNDLKQYLGAEGDLASLTERLIEHIRHDELAGREAELLLMLERVTLAKMAVDNPRYSSYKKRMQS